MPKAIQHFTLDDQAITDKKPEAHEATRHFTDLEAKNVGKTEAICTHVEDKEVHQALPSEYFNRLGCAELAARTNAQRKLSEREMPISIAQDKANAIVEQQR